MTELFYEVTILKRGDDIQIIPQPCSCVCMTIKGTSLEDAETKALELVKQGWGQ